MDDGYAIEDGLINLFSGVDTILLTGVYSLFKYNGHWGFLRFTISR